MAAPLITCTKIEQRGVVRFLWAKNMEAKDIHKEMLPMYGKHCLSRQAVHNWVQKFSDGWENAFLTILRLKEQCARGSNSNQKIFRRRFPGTCKMVGQVFKSVWRLC